MAEDKQAPPSELDDTISSTWPTEASAASDVDTEDGAEPIYVPI